MNNVAAIRTYFEQIDKIAPNGGKKITMSELKGMSAKDREELGDLCREALGVSK